MELGNFIFGNSRGVYSIERDEVISNNFIIFLENLGLDSYGYPSKTVSSSFLKKDMITPNVFDCYYEDDRFIIRPYYWGESNEISTKPNFVDKKELIEINWYKYPFRDSYINKEINLENYVKMLKELK